MGPMLEALMHLQSIERQLAHVRGRLKTRKNAVAAQQRRIDQINADYTAQHDKSITRRKDADRLELELRGREEQVVKLRTVLNLAKTNKEYAAILTQINTCKADNAKIEEEVLKIMQDVDAIKIQADKFSASLETEQKRLTEIEQASGQEIQKLTAMLEEAHGATHRRGGGRAARVAGGLRTHCRAKRRRRDGRHRDPRPQAALRLHLRRVLHEPQRRAR